MVQLILYTSLLEEPLRPVDSIQMVCRVTTPIDGAPGLLWLTFDTTDDGSSYTMDPVTGNDAVRSKDLPIGYYASVASVLEVLRHSHTEMHLNPEFLSVSIEESHRFRSAGHKTFPWTISIGGLCLLQLSSLIPHMYVIYVTADVRKKLVNGAVVPPSDHTRSVGTNAENIA